MPGPMPNNLPSNHLITEIADQNGNIICQVGYSTYSVRDDQGNMQTFQKSQNITLSDGSVWNPGMMKAPGIFLGVCQSCRNPHFSLWHKEIPTHGLTALHTATRCANPRCHSLCCPKHSILCSDGLYRCPKCVKSYNSFSWLKRIFFKIEED